MDSDVVIALREFRQALDAQEIQLMQDMAIRWTGIEATLQKDIAKLAEEMAKRAANGTTITEQMVWRSERYQILQRQMEEQIARYNKDYALGTITGAQKEASLLGINAAQTAIDVSFGPGGGAWTRLNLHALDSIFGFAGDGSPLYNLLQESYPDSVDGLLEALINGMARGQGSAQTANDMADGMGMGLERALLIARTENARAYRTGSGEQYRESGVVAGQKRLVKRETACLACLMLDGEIIPIDANLDDHPRGKCSVVPCMIGAEPPSWEYGQAWFEGLSDDQQIAMMGVDRWDAWQDGVFSLDQLAQIAHSDVWGDSPRVATLAELLR